MASIYSLTPLSANNSMHAVAAPIKDAIENKIAAAVAGVHAPLADVTNRLNKPTEQDAKLAVAKTKLSAGAKLFLQHQEDDVDQELFLLDYEDALKKNPKLITGSVSTKTNQNVPVESLFVCMNRFIAERLEKDKQAFQKDWFSLKVCEITLRYYFIHLPNDRFQNLALDLLNEESFDCAMWKRTLQSIQCSPNERLRVKLLLRIMETYHDLGALANNLFTPVRFSQVLFKAFDTRPDLVPDGNYSLCIGMQTYVEDLMNYQERMIKENKMEIALGLQTIINELLFAYSCYSVLIPQDELYARIIDAISKLKEIDCLILPIHAKNHAFLFKFRKQPGKDAYIIEEINTGEGAKRVVFSKKQPKRQLGQNVIIAGICINQIKGFVQKIIRQIHDTLPIKPESIYEDLLRLPNVHVSLTAPIKLQIGPSCSMKCLTKYIHYRFKNLFLNGEHLYWGWKVDLTKVVQNDILQLFKNNNMVELQKFFSVGSSAALEATKEKLQAYVEEMLLKREGKAKTFAALA